MARTNTIEKAYCPECGEQFEPGTKTCPNDGSRLFSYQVRDGDEDRLVGRTIEDRFRIDSILGEGGMGRVYRGVQLSVERPVAIKVLRPELIDREDVIQRFFREARVISGFNHPNIVNLVDFGQDAEHDVLYLAMELLDGMPLSDVMVRGRAHPNLACEVAVQVSRALAEAHSREIVHRDLKPDNLMLVPMSDGSVQVKVLDFGIAHAVQGEKKLTSTGQVFGTAHYMAPEQASGKEVGPLTDVYALGCILYEMICGKLPFDAPSVMGLLVSHVQQEPPHLADRLRDDDIPDALVDLVMQMLEKAPIDRPKSVLAVRDRVEQIRAEQGFGPVRVDPSSSLDRGLFQNWLRGEHSARLRETSEPLQRATGDHVRNTAENAGFATAETAAHPSAPSIDEVPSFDSVPGSEPAIQPAMQGAPPAGSAPPNVGTPDQSHSRPDQSANQPVYQAGPPVSNPSVELELAKMEENKRLFRLAGGLFLIVLLVGGVAAVLAMSSETNGAVVAGADAGADPGGETTAIAENDEPAVNDPVVADEPDTGSFAGADSGMAATEQPAETVPDEPIVEEEPVKAVEKKPVKTVEKKAIQKKPADKKPAETKTNTKDDEKTDEKSVETVVLPM